MKNIIRTFLFLAMIINIYGCSQMAVVKSDEKVVLFENNKDKIPYKILTSGEEYSQSSRYNVIQPNEYYVVNGIKISTAVSLEGTIFINIDKEKSKNPLFLIVEITNVGKVKTDKEDIDLLFSNIAFNDKTEIRFNKILSCYESAYTSVLTDIYLKFGDEYDYKSNYDLIGKIIKDELNKKRLSLLFTNIIVSKFEIKKS